MHATDSFPTQPVTGESERPVAPSGAGSEATLAEAVPRGDGRPVDTLGAAGAPANDEATDRQSALRALRNLEATEARLARNAKRDYSAALRVMHGAGGGDDSGWQVPVLMMSAQTGDGIDVLWAKLQEHRDAMRSSGRFEQKRRAQLRSWMWSMVERRVLAALHEHPDVSEIAPGLEADVLAGKLTPTLGAQALLRAFGIGE